MEKYFLEILHKGEVMNETSLENLLQTLPVQLLLNHNIIVEIDKRNIVNLII